MYIFETVKEQTIMIIKLRSIVCHQGMHLTSKDRYCLRVKGQEKEFRASRTGKRGATILVSDDTNFKLELVRRGKESLVTSKWWRE